MKQEHFQVLLGFAIFAIIVYFIFKLKNVKEGMETESKSGSSAGNGVAGNAETYAAKIKSNTIQMQDTFLIGKYRKEYETVILNLDDFLNCRMLDTILNVDPKDKDKIIESFKTLNALAETKNSINQVMKFVDSQ
jgi:hypothetical protein